MSNRSRYQIADSQQFQSVLTSNGDTFSSPPDPRTRVSDLLSYRAPTIDVDGRPCDRFPWMQVSVHAEEVLRNNVVPADTPVLPSQTIRNAGQSDSQLGARLILSDDTQESRVVDVDIAGGFTFTWAGSGVAVKVLTQENGGPIREIPDEGLNGVIVVDTIVGASATVGGVGNETGSGGGGSLSPSCLTLTQTKLIGPGGVAFFEVPSGACRVSVYRTAGPTIVGAWITYYQGPEAAPTVVAGLGGLIPGLLSLGQQQIQVPGTARALALVNGAGVGNVVSVVWELEL